MFLMDLRSLVPALDRAPLPAPVWVFQVLLLVTFFLHLLPMNFLLGGGVYALILRVRGRGGPDDSARRLGRTIDRMLPAATAATVTLGVAPLLFVQVLYGQFFYTSSILIGSFWLMIVPLLILAYFGFYREAFRGGTGPIWVRAGSVLIVVAIGFLLSYNMQLMMDPSAWEAHHVVGSSGRLAFSGNILGPGFLARWIHMMTGAAAVTGLWLFAVGMVKGRGGDEDLAALAKRHGADLFLWGTVLSIVTGFWFLFSLPDSLRDEFLKGSPARGLPWMLAPLLSLGGALLLRKGAAGGIALGLVSLVLMVVLRHNLRDRALESATGFRAADLPSAPQWGVMALFLLVLVVSLAVVYAMLRMTLRRKSG